MMKYIVNDHKTGFSVSRKIQKCINSFYTNEISFRTMYKFWNVNDQNDKYVCFIRNPYEIIVSGYLYHKRCFEKWCITKNLSYYEQWISSDHFFQSEKIKNQEALNNSIFCKNISYQEKLNSLNQDDGIIFEMKNVAKLTIEGMCDFNYFESKNVMSVKLENLTHNYEYEIRRILDFLEINNNETLISRLNIHNIKKHGVNNHVTNKNLDKDRYLQYFNDKLFKEFNSIYKEYIPKINKLGYTTHV
jgi:hypothetical protein